MKATNIKEFFFLLRKGIQLKIAVEVAKTKQKAFNKRFWVLPDENHKLRAICNTEIKWLKKHGFMNKKVTHLDLEKECFYYTPLSLNNDGTISKEEREKKKQEWIKYSKKISKIRQ